MSNWGSENFRVGKSSPGSLQDVINQFPKSLKQAMYAAASTRLIKRGTWSGCALNAAGDEIGVNANSTSNAASAFNIPDQLVTSFISKWDKLQGTDEECTKRLKIMLEDANLFEEPQEAEEVRTGKKIVSVVVYEDQRKKFDELVQAELVEFTDLAEMILNSPPEQDECESAVLV